MARVITESGAAAGAYKVRSTALEASRVLRASPGALLGLVGHSSKVGSQYIQVFDAASLPADGVAPDIVFIVNGSSNFSLGDILKGIPFSIGIVVCNSSTLATKTIGSADCYFTAVIEAPPV